MASKDRVDRIREYWAKECPEWDTSAIEVWDRILLLERWYFDALKRVMSKYGLRVGAFDVLAALRRAGPPHTLNPTQLSYELVLSSGAMTNRLDRLADEGFISRTPDPDDRRGWLITLTKEGLDVIEEALAVQYTEGLKLLGNVTEEERDILARLLRKLEDCFDED